VRTEKIAASGRIVVTAVMAVSLLTSAVVVAGAGQARPEGAPAPAPPARSWAVSLRWENDTFGDTDHFYTNGAGLAVSHTGPSWADPLFDLLPWRDNRRTVSYALGQAMFTPDDTSRVIPDPTDRPYAGVLAFSLGLDADQPNRYDGLRLILGVVGPASGAEDVQKQVHRIISSDIPQGWDSQLHNEPLLNINYEHRRRFRLLGTPDGWSTEAIPIASVGLGNMLTQGQLAGVLRFGYRMPQTFGPTVLRGMTQVPPPRATPSESTSFWRSLGVGVHAGGGVNLVVRDVTLDGNLFSHSAHVASELFVPAAIVGVELGSGRFLATFSYVWLGKEFEGQREAAQFSALTVSYFF
jgi:hypothetical protein